MVGALSTRASGERVLHELVRPLDLDGLTAEAKHIIPTMLLRSVVERSGYDEADFCRRLDEELFPRLDGTPMSGPGGYTSQSIREAWRRRVEQKLIALARELGEQAEG